MKTNLPMPISGWLQRTVAIASMCLVYGSAQALPALQIGPDPDNPDHWSYDMGTDTWVTMQNSFNLLTLANANTTGGTGAYAWDGAGSIAQWAYLVVAATPKAADDTDLFDISLMNDGAGLTMVDSGFGNPFTAPHGIFDTYYEIWEFQFDKSPVDIGNTEPGANGGTGKGYSETIGVEVNSLLLGALGLHFDLFTMTGTGKFGEATNNVANALKTNAPFSHDAELSVVPVPAAFWLFGTALIGFIGYSRRRQI